MLRSRSAVSAVHEHALGRGDRVLQAPQVFPGTRNPTFATFWLDPFWFTLEAVCHFDVD